MKKYNDISKEQKEFGIIETANESGALGETYYLPDHPVIRKDKNTTKVKVVLTLPLKRGHQV